MPILTAHPRPPKFWACEATLDNLPYLENWFRDGEVSVRTDFQHGRMFTVKLSEIKKADKTVEPEIEVVVAEGDYFMFEDGFFRGSLRGIERSEFLENFQVDESLDTGHG